MSSVNDNLADAQIMHMVRVEYLKNGIVKRMINLLSESDAELRAKLTEAAENLTGTEFSLSRIESQLSSIYLLNSQLYAAMNDGLQYELEGFAEYEATWQQSTFDKELPTGISFERINTTQVHAAAVARPFQGRLLSEWMADIEGDAAKKIRDAVRLGVIQGETTDQIVRRIRGTRANAYQDGLIAINRRNATAIVRTAVAHTQDVARDAVYQANADLIKGEVWNATLDTRVCPQCFPASVVVQPIGNLSGVFSRHYEGDIIVITTASGKKLSATENHPILTSAGWRSANELRPMHDILYSVDGDVANIFSDEGVQMPTSIGALFNSINDESISDIFTIRSSEAQFHGDGMAGNNEVKYVSIKGDLRLHLESKFGKSVSEKFLSFIASTGFLSRNSEGDFLLMSNRLKNMPSEITLPSFNDFIEGRAADFCNLHDLMWLYPIVKHLNDFGLVGAFVDLSSFEMLHSPMLFEHASYSGGGSSENGSNTPSRLSASVSLDYVVSVDREFFSGHVYNLSCDDTGLYIANGLIVHNCAELDGKIFELGKGPRPPIHLNDRCVRLPVLKSWRELGFDIDELPPSTRASMDGQVPGDLTFGNWLKRQSAERQDEVLGKERGRIYRETGAPLDKFINREGKYYTLDELKKLEL